MPDVALLNRDTSQVGPTLRPERAPRESEIRRELDHILAAAPFRNSKRYSSVLRFLVERTLEGRSGELKERTIGIEVFQRPPDYDTNADHAVRSAASEIRKRLAQYYQEAGSSSVVLIELHPGSYVPGFTLPKVAEETSTDSVEVIEPNEISEERHISRRSLLGILGGISALGVAGAVSSYRSRHAASVLSRFWGPALSQPGALALCVGNHISGAELDNVPVAWAMTEKEVSRFSTGIGVRPSDLVSGCDVIALVLIASQMQSMEKATRVFLSASASLEDLQERAAVLIGGYNNQWTLRMLRNLRFRLEGRDGRIIDSTSSGKSWSPLVAPGGKDYMRDYGLITRYANPETGRMVIVAAGTQGYGTLASAQFLTDEALMTELISQAPAGWEHKNVQVVLGTDIVNQVVGRPSILATHFW